MDQPSIFHRNLWLEQQTRLMELLMLALSLLEQDEPLPDPEEEITRRLARCCDKAQWLLDKEGRAITGTLHWETKDLLQYRDIGIPVKAVKEPDCQYEFQDQQALRWRDYKKSLTIECKRLGRFPDSSHTRKLNQAYVQEGIRRFLDDGHSYGRSAPCGIMIGYVQNMNFDEILSEVNAECTCRLITELTLSDQGWQAGLSSHLVHSFHRAFPISPFTLRHVWADLRRHYARTPG